MVHLSDPLPGSGLFSNHEREVFLTLRGFPQFGHLVDQRGAVFVKGVVRRFHAASLISGALISVSGLSQTGP
ncbi:hypothetical protein, partial [Primorskyibacter sedentarius]|uniref:hypothetical protein n=1 Tax=Primorskyibacter sedentarius TaxID=745311 RepID=UPI001FB212B0